MNALPPDRIREALINWTVDSKYESPDPPPPADVYIVPGHAEALDPKTPLVVGGRGTGKSFWSSALLSQTIRANITSEFKRLDLRAVKVSRCFGPATSPDDYPSRHVIDGLERQVVPVSAIFRAIVLWHLTGKDQVRIPGADWLGRAQWVSEHAEACDRLIAEFDQRLVTSGERHLLVFDALDRLAEDWIGIRPRARELLRTCLDLLGTRAITPKLFVRPDMAEDKVIWAFPDASKLKHRIADLRWRRRDLYGMLYQFLRRRELLDGRALTNADLRTDEDAQRKLFESIAGQWMGSNRRRGSTYLWLVGHLADAKGETSPRSFVLALQEAAQRTRDEYKGDYALHYKGIQDGVRLASDRRVDELREDHWWINEVLAPLKGQLVPCDKEDLINSWKKSGTLDKLQTAFDELRKSLSDSSAPSLMPSHVDTERENGLIAALEEIGVIEIRSDGRVNVPDLYRVGAHMKRRGGVVPQQAGR